MVGTWALVAVSAVVVGYAFVRASRFANTPSEGDAARRQRLEAARPFLEAAPGDDAILEGVIVELDDQGTTAPIAKRRAVWLEIEATEERRADSDAPFEHLFSERVAVPFQVSLPDRRCVPVRWASAVEVIGATETRTGPVVQPSDALAAFLTARGRKPLEPGEFVRRREYVERVLDVGRKVLLLGTRREPSEAHRSTNYRGHERAAYLEADFVDVADDRAALVRRGLPERGVGVPVGTFVAVAAPIAAFALGARGVPLTVSSGLFLSFVALPLGTFLLWAVAVVVREFFT
jgi:hypothetical protein